MYELSNNAHATLLTKSLCSACCSKLRTLHVLLTKSLCSACCSKLRQRRIQEVHTDLFFHFLFGYHKYSDMVILDNVAYLDIIYIFHIAIIETKNIYTKTYTIHKLSYSYISLFFRFSTFLFD